MSTLLGSSFSRFSRSTPIGQEATMTRISIITVLAVITLTPSLALAAAPFTSFEIDTPQYDVGVPMVDATTEARATCEAYAACLDDKGSCEIMILGSSSDSEHFDLTKWPEYTAEANLAGARASNYSRQINDQCQRMDVSLNWDHVHMVPPNPHASAQYRYATSSVRPTVDGGTAAAGPPKKAMTVAERDDAFKDYRFWVWDHRNNLCPTHVWVNAATGDFNVTGDDCDCTNHDISDLPGYQIYGEAAEDTWLERQIAADAELQGKTWTQMIRHLSDNPRDSHVEVDVDGNLLAKSDTDGGGLSLEVHYNGMEATVQFPNRCAAKQRADAEDRAIADAARAQQSELARLQSYHVDGYARANFVPGYIDRSQLSPYNYAAGPTYDGVIEAGVLWDIGSHDVKKDVDPDGDGPKPIEKDVVVGYHYSPVSLMGGLIFDVGHDPDCVRPAVIGWGGVAGFAFNRAYRVSFEADGYYLRSGAPYPDGDGTNLDLQRERVGVRGGVRVSLFGEGTHAGYIGIDPYVQADFLTARTPASGMNSATAVPGYGAWAYFGWDF